MKVRATNGVSYGVKHTITVNEVPANAIAEVVTLEVTGAPTADGTLTITLPSLAGVEIAILDTDDEAGVATKIRAGTFTGWTTGGIGAEVTFTNDVAGDVEGEASFDAGDTEAVATIEVTTDGVDEFLGGAEFDFSIGGVNYRYPLVAVVNCYNAGVLTNPVDLAISYPRNGVIKVDGTLVLGHTIEVVAQRDSLN